MSALVPGQLWNGAEGDWLVLHRAWRWRIWSWIRWSWRPRGNERPADQLVDQSQDWPQGATERRKSLLALQGTPYVVWQKAPTMDTPSATSGWPWSPPLLESP